MSDLGLGFKEVREERRKRKKHQKPHSFTTDLDRIARFGYPKSKNSSPRAKVIGEALVQEGEEEGEEEYVLNADDHSVSHTILGIMEGLEHEERNDEEEENPGRQNSSFSNSPTEKFHNHRINSEMHPLTTNKQRVPRTASLDLSSSHNAAVLSPQFFVGGLAGGKNYPWTPNYQKGWSSERVPLPTNARQRYLCNGKALPSKWEDAERWIGSPVSVDVTGRLVLPSYYRRPKSKSGPLGPHSPLVPCFDSGRVVNVAASSPFLAGVLVADRQCYGSARGGTGDCGGGRFVSANVESYIIQQSAALHEWSDLSSPGTPQDEKLDSKEGSIVVSPKVLQKDTSTQMRSAERTHSSPDRWSNLSIVPPSADPIVELDAHFSKLEIRDVQVDGHVTVTKRPKKHVPSDRCLGNIIEWKNKTDEEKASAWEIAESSKFLSKYSREEAKIRAWRNLQEAKAEAAIRKLEMKLEKERSSSMEKIVNKLRSAQRKAVDMRSAARAKEPDQTQKTRRKASLFIRSGHLSFLGSCFTCHAA